MSSNPLHKTEPKRSRTEAGKPEPAGSAIRLLIVDDHELVRAGLRAVFAEYSDITIVGEAGSGEQAVTLAGELRPDVVLMDLKLPDLSGVEACRRILAASPDCRVVILSSFGEDEEIFAAVMAGASGYILKEQGHASVLEAIRRAHLGQSTFDAEMTDRIIRKVKAVAAGRPPTESTAPLSERDVTLLRMVAGGKTNKEIGQEIGLSDQTVKHHLKVLLAKLGLTNRSQAAAWAARNLSLKE